MTSTGEWRWEKEKWRGKLNQSRPVVPPSPGIRRSNSMWSWVRKLVVCSSTHSTLSRGAFKSKCLWTFQAISLPDGLPPLQMIFGATIANKGPTIDVWWSCAVCILDPIRERTLEHSNKEGAMLQCWRVVVLPKPSLFAQLALLVILNHAYSLSDCFQWPLWA